HDVRSFFFPSSPFPTVMESLILERPSARAELFLQGGHLASYEVRGLPVLFLSKRAEFAPGKAIRGGIPVCFPWFGPHPTDPNLPAHGFARTAHWQLIERGADFAVLGLSSNVRTLAQWPHAFEVNYRIKLLETGLHLEFEVENTGARPFTFETALHSYFVVSDVKEAVVEGLDGKTYLDHVTGNDRKVQAGNVTFTGETDRLYVDAPGPVRLRDEFRTIRIINLEGWRSTTVWNPWTEKARALKDLGEDQWPGFVCVEAGFAADDAVTLEPGDRYRLAVEIKVDEVP
ncbi:MAG: D-hexose-6-phosphate mutarotase, partial [Verrucomicrobium sp.]